jgi:hypothetical protein
VNTGLGGLPSLSSDFGIISSWPGDERRSEVGGEGFLRGGEGEPLFTVKRLERGRVGAGGEGDCDADSKSDLVFWKKLLLGIEGDDTGVRAIVIVRSVGRLGI